MGHQGVKTDESKQVTNVSTKPDILLYRKDFISSNRVAAAVTACPTTPIKVKHWI